MPLVMLEVELEIKGSIFFTKIVDLDFLPPEDTEIHVVDIPDLSEEPLSADVLSIECRLNKKWDETKNPKFYIVLDKIKRNVHPISRQEDWNKVKTALIRDGWKRRGDLCS